jgi:hypothetical protein
MPHTDLNLEWNFILEYTIQYSSFLGPLAEITKAPRIKSKWETKYCLILIGQANERPFMSTYSYCILTPFTEKKTCTSFVMLNMTLRPGKLMDYSASLLNFFWFLCI